MVILDTMNVELNQCAASSEQHEDIERKARVDALWQQMNKGISGKTLNSIINKRSSNVKKPSQKSSSQNWMTVLNLAPKKILTNDQCSVSQSTITPDVISDDAIKLASAALLAVRDVASAVASGRGKIEVTEIRDFAGEEIEVKKLLDASSSEASGKGKAPVSTTSAVDAFLEQIKKKPKLSVLDKTKKDWGEFKEEKGLEEELDAYKKSSNQYLDKVSFLERTDYREFERERDARLSLQSKRKADMREDF